MLKPFLFCCVPLREGHRGAPESDLLSAQRLFTLLRNTIMGLGIRLPQLFLQKWARRPEESRVGLVMCKQDSLP